MIPSAEKLAIMVVSADAGVRDFLATAAKESGWFGAVGHIAQGKLAGTILTNQVCGWPRYGVTWFDVIATDQDLPGLVAIAPIAAARGLLYPPFAARFLYPHEEAGVARLRDDGFDFCTALPDSVEGVAEIFRNLAGQYLHGKVGCAFDPRELG